MENKVDPVAAECARQEAEIAACTSRWAKLRIVLSYFCKRGKLIAAYERARLATEGYEDADTHAEMTIKAQISLGADEALEAAIAEFAAGEGA